MGSTLQWEKTPSQYIHWVHFPCTQGEELIKYGNGTCCQCYLPTRPPTTMRPTTTAAPICVPPTYHTNCMKQCGVSNLFSVLNNLTNHFLCVRKQHWIWNQHFVLSIFMDNSFVFSVNIVLSQCGTSLWWETREWFVSGGLRLSRPDVVQWNRLCSFQRLFLFETRNKPDSSRKCKQNCLKMLIYQYEDIYVLNIFVNIFIFWLLRKMKYVY